MIRFISAAVGGLCLVWYAFAYPGLFEYFMLDISLMSTLGNCREQYGIETCRLIAHAIFRLWELPLNLLVYGPFAALLVMAEKYIDRLQLSYLGLGIGLASTYVALAWNGLTPGLLVGHVINLLLYLSFLLAGVWAFRHILNKSWRMKSTFVHSDPTIFS